MADRVAPGAWWLHATSGSNVYLLEVEGGDLVLIDTGFGSSAPGIIAEVESLAPGRGVSLILLTHHHVDHAGAAAALRAHYGCPVAAGAADCEVSGEGVFELREPLGRSHLMRRLGRLGGRGGAERLTVDRPLTGGMRVAPGVLAVPTPGHTPGSYCYVASDRDLAFVGDLVISHDDTLARPLKMANDDDAQYLRTLAWFAEQAPAIGCAGHGPPVLADFAAQLRALAALPRRSMLSPRGMLDRARRMGAFSRRIRRPGGR